MLKPLPSKVQTQTAGSEPAPRPSGRAADVLRPVSIEVGVNAYAEGSCLIAFGNTRVLCTASVDEKIPVFLRGSGSGWVTAEYGMLPRSTHKRMDREAVKGKQSGRTVEISRLIGRAIRSVVDLEALGERTIWLDCDVLQADGGTRTAAITGAYVATHLALQGLFTAGKLDKIPLTDYVAAISCGITTSGPVLDLDYVEDSSAIADANFILTGKGGIIEVQATAEKTPITDQQFNALMALARQGVTTLVKHQREAIDRAPKAR